MHKFLYLLILAIALTSCKKDIELREGQRFFHAVVPNQQACDQVRQQGPVFNCFQSLEFLGDHVVEVVVTDILNRGRYKIRGNKIIIRFEGNYDTPDKMEFEIVDDNTLRYKGTNWKRWKGPGGWDFY